MAVKPAAVLGGPHPHQLRASIGLSGAGSIGFRKVANAVVFGERRAVGLWRPQRGTQPAVAGYGKRSGKKTQIAKTDTDRAARGDEQDKV